MQYLYIILAFLSLSLWSYQIELFLSEKNKKYTFFIAIALINICTFHITLYSNFWVAQYFIYFLTTILIGFMFKTKSFKLFKDFLATYKLFFIFSFVWFLLTIKAQVLGWDDFYWASFVKYLSMFGHYWDENSFINHEVLRYLPGIPIWEVFFTGKGYFNEQALFFALGLFFLAGLNVFLPKNVNYKSFFTFLILYCSGIYWFAPGGINNISVDEAIGLIFAVSLIFIFEFKSILDLVACLILIIYFAITKETAFLLSLLCLFIMFFKLAREKKIFSRNTAFCLSGFGIIIFNSASWQRYLGRAHLTVPVAKMILDGFKNDLVSLTVRTHDTLIIFAHALVSRPFPDSRFSTTFLAKYINLHGTFLICSIIFAAFLLFVLKKQYEYFVGFIIGLIGYTSILLANWLYFSGEYEGRFLASYERYFGMYFLGFSIFIIYIFLEKKLYEVKLLKYLLIIVICLFPPSVKMLYPPSIKVLIPNWVNRIYPFQKYEVREDVATIKNKILNLTPANSKIWFIWQNSTGLQNMIMRYEVAPRFLNSFKWSIGEKYYEGDVWTAPMTVNNLAAELKNFDYIALGKIDTQFIKNFSNIFKDTPKESNLYKMTEIKGESLLIEVK